jgi:hypothetical protein
MPGFGIAATASTALLRKLLHCISMIHHQWLFLDRSREVITNNDGVIGSAGELNVWEITMLFKSFQRSNGNLFLPTSSWEMVRVYPLFQYYIAMRNVSLKNFF